MNTMTRTELEEVICELHRRIALTTAGTPLQDDLIKATGALRIAVNRITELEAQLLKEAHWVAIHNGMGVCSNCNRQDRIDNLATHCRYCGARMRKGEHDEN